MTEMSISTNKLDCSSNSRSMIIVAGMHRSGTSVITRVMNLCGATLSDSLLLPLESENERGFWECPKIMELHDEIFESFGFTWSSLAAIPPEWFSSAEAAKYKERLKAILNEQYGEFQLGVIKDPRICKLIPLWESLFSEMSINTHYIISVRNPLEVIKSLKFRNEFKRRYALSLWFVHLRSLEEATRSLNRVFVRYEDILTDYVSVIEYINRFLGIKLDPAAADVEEQVGSFLSNSLRHHNFDSSDLQKNKKIPPVVKFFHNWLQLQSSLESDSSAREVVLDLRNELKKTPNSDFVLFLQNLESLEKLADHKYSEIEELHSAYCLEKRRGVELLETNALLEKQIDSSELVIKEQSERLLLREKENKNVLKDLSVLRSTLNIEKNSGIETRKKYKKLLRLTAENKRNLQTIELRMRNLMHTGAWKLGVRAARFIRSLRSSIFGKIILMLKALSTFRLQAYIAERKSMQIIRKSGLFNEDYYRSTYPLLAYSLKPPFGTLCDKWRR